MRATEFIIDNVEEKLKNVPTKPRNFVAKNAMKTTSGAGAHRDKKKEQKQGDFKHKNQSTAEATGDVKFDKMLKDITGKKEIAKQQKTDTKQQARDAFDSMFGGGNPADKLGIRKKGVAEGSYTTEKQILTRIRQIMHDRKLSGTESNAGELHRLKQQLKDMRSQLGVAEGVSDLSQKRIGPDKNDPWEQGWRARPGHDFNPYRQGTPEYAQWEDGQAEREAQPNHYESVVAEKAPPGEKAERMVKHIKKGYAKDGGLSDKERSIAYATAWKHHNK
jgi:hypothetical protein